MSNNTPRPVTGLRTIVRAEYAAKVAANRASGPAIMAAIHAASTGKGEGK